MNKISRQEVKKTLTLEQVRELRDWGEVVIDSGYIESTFIEFCDYEFTEVITFSKEKGFERVYRVEELTLEADSFEELETKVASLEYAWAEETRERDTMCFW